MSLSQLSGCLSCQHGISLELLLPHLTGVAVEAAELAGGLLCVWACVRADRAACPRCGHPSGRVHSSYERRLKDAPVGGHRVLIRLGVRRFFCGNPECAAVTFAEQVAGLTARRARRTPPLARTLSAIAAALAGRAGARLAARLDLAAGRTGLLRLVMALPDPEPAPVRVPGVDDFAFRRGRDYGTVLVNAETGQPVDLLRDREAGTLEEWLREHPGTEVICRDRAGAYADRARQGAPSAIQVADRWHIYHNLAERVDKAVARHCSCLTEPGPEPEDRPDQPAPDLEQAAAAAAEQRAADSALAVRSRERYELVQALRAQGMGSKPIMRQTGLAKETVRRFYRAGSADELLAKVTGGRPSLLDDYKPHLHQRWNEGCAPASASCTPGSATAATAAATAPSATTWHRSASSAPPRRPYPPRRRPATWPDGSSATRSPSTTTRKPSSARSGTAARTWTRSRGTSPSSPRSSPACTATASMTGSPPSKPMTSLTCTPSPAAYGTTTTPSATA